MPKSFAVQPFWAGSDYNALATVKYSSFACNIKLFDIAAIVLLQNKPIDPTVVGNKLYIQKDTAFDKLSQRGNAPLSLP